jgi:hypothetical protein
MSRVRLMALVIARAGYAKRYMQDKKKNVSLESLNESLTKAAKSLDKAAGQIRDLSLEPTSKNIRLIGESLANISAKSEGTGQVRGDVVEK